MLKHAPLEGRLNTYKYDEKAFIPIGARLNVSALRYKAFKELHQIKGNLYQVKSKSNVFFKLI